jgi:hypothetical protein
MNHISRRKVLIGTGIALTGGTVTAVEGLRMGTMAAYSANAASSRRPLADSAELRELVRFATLAASGHNTQPWRFRLSPRRIEILPDWSRRTPAVDPDDHHLFVSLGCALENLTLAARARGLEAMTTLEADDRLTVTLVPSQREESVLVRAIPLRQSTRGLFDGRSVPAEDLRRLLAAASASDVDVGLLTDRPSLERVLGLVIEGNSAQMADDAFVRELKSWIRFNPRTAMASADGLFSEASGSPSAPGWLGSVLFDRMFQQKAENAKYAGQVRSSAGVAVFVGASQSHSAWIDVGRSCQRFALEATVLGIRTSFLNQPLEVASLRPALAALVGAEGRRPDIVMRVSVRRSVSLKASLFGGRVSPTRRMSARDRRQRWRSRRQVGCDELSVGARPRLGECSRLGRRAGRASVHSRAPMG